MKRFLLSMMTLAATVVAGFAADTYTPLVREGVEWGYITQEYGKISYHRLRFYGSEIVNGKEYHKLVAYTSYNGEYDKVPMAWMREENRKVYCIYLDTPLANDFIGSRNAFTLTGTYPKQEEIMIFDFSLKKGDKFSLPDVGDFTCTETGYMDVADGRRQYWKLGGICWGLDYALFVEGMGPVFLNCSWGASILVPYHFETSSVPDFTKRDFLLYEREYNGYMGLDIAAFRGKDIYKSGSITNCMGNRIGVCR